ncbi:uncharacterized protein BT62DRAFT_1026561 [Guyanagaster necrorhizus]|uniref:Uncharacterized protein n=1 Tax=Guyanagaster necrorhizus TaxID=856835 RepID=A0A9P7VQB7_9AGAR|nr:uncharacterized protein BT62DRAFT_1026561 [Guyanagaster necrorhizus MCA 3950]KAG7445471.1 hypothetical protein BT62DRAFT_1026561 [Guyanagaster necrorhizus MCA 3950]
MAKSMKMLVAKAADQDSLGKMKEAKISVHELQRFPNTGMKYIRLVPGQKVDTLTAYETPQSLTGDIDTGSLVKVVATSLEENCKQRWQPGVSEHNLWKRVLYVYPPLNGHIYDLNPLMLSLTYAPIAFLQATEFYPMYKMRIRSNLSIDFLSIGDEKYLISNTLRTCNISELYIILTVLKQLHYMPNELLVTWKAN